MPEMYAQGEIFIFEVLLLFRSAFARLVAGHFKAPNHLNLYLLRDFFEPYTEPSQGTDSSSFYSLLYFCKSRQGYIKAPNHLRFSPLLYFGESHQLRLFFNSQPCTVWCNANIQSCAVSCNSSTAHLRFLRSSLSGGQNFCWFRKFPGRPHNPCNHTSHVRMNCSLLFQQYPAFLIIFL